MNQSIYCVLEGETYPEGAPDAIFETLEEAKNYIQTRTDTPESKRIFQYTIGRDGYEAVFNYLGEKTI